MIYLLLSFRERAAFAGPEYLTPQGKSQPLWSLPVPVRLCKSVCHPWPPKFRDGRAGKLCSSAFLQGLRLSQTSAWTACWGDPHPSLTCCEDPGREVMCIYASEVIYLHGIHLRKTTIHFTSCIIYSNPQESNGWERSASVFLPTQS